MAKSRESFDKKNKAQKRIKQRNDKAQKMEERKADAKKGKSLEDMIAYVDENGNITDTPPDMRNRKPVALDDIQIGIPAGNLRDSTRKGTIHFFNEEKGFGFVTDDSNGQQLFFHESSIDFLARTADKVVFDTDMNERGVIAINIRKARTDSPVTKVLNIKA